MKNSCGMYVSSLHYNKEGWRKVALCIYHYFIITRKEKEKLRYVYIITSFQQGRMKKSCGMYISSLHYNKEGWGKVALCSYHHFFVKGKDQEEFWYVFIITFIITWEDEEKLWYVHFSLYCPCRYFAQNPKSWGGIVIALTYVKTGTYP